MKGLFTTALLLVATLSHADQWIVRTEALFLKATEKGMAFVNRPSNVLTTDDFTCRPLHHPRFGWDWGFRQSLGYRPCGWHWDFEFTWTYFATRQSTREHADCNEFEYGGMFPVMTLYPDLVYSNYVTDAHMRWKLNLNLFDIDIRDTITFYDHFAFQWHAGIRIPWIRQNYHFDYSGGIFANGEDENTFRNNYIGAGPRLGFELSFPIWNNFSLYGQVAGSIVFGEFDLQHREEYLEYTCDDTHDNFYRTTFNSDLGAGVRWLGWLCQFPFTLAVGWEQHVFYNMNRLKRGNYHFFSNRHNLYLQGLVINATGYF